MRVSVKRSGYLENTQQLDVTTHRSQDFELTPTRLGDYAGNYRLTITGSCPAGLPERASRRVYDARVVQSGDRLTVYLTGADFILVPDSWVDYFSAKVGPGDVIELDLGDWYGLLAVRDRRTVRRPCARGDRLWFGRREAGCDFRNPARGVHVSECEPRPVRTRGCVSPRPLRNDSALRVRPCSTSSQTTFTATNSPSPSVSGTPRYWYGEKSRPKPRRH